MTEVKLKIPTAINIGTISTDKLQTAVTAHRPQIIQHLAFVPLETQNINEKLLETIALIEEFKLEQDLIIKDPGEYDSAVYQNKTNKTVVVPAATHLKGGHQNRGNNQTEVLGAGDKKTFDVNCFEPNRGSGTDHFNEFEDVPVDVAKETMLQTDGYDGSWPIIGNYTKLAKVSRSDALSSFNEKTEEERAKYALNFETVNGQTGVAILTRGLSAIEVFPTPNVFNIYQQRILRGKLASLFYRLHKEQGNTVLMPSEVETKLNEMMNIIKTGIEQTIEHGTKVNNLTSRMSKAHEILHGTTSNGLIIGRVRQGKKAIDIILTDTEQPQLVYLFGAW